MPDLIADAAAIVAALPPITLSTEIVSATTPASPPASSTPPTPVTPVVPVPPEASQYTHSLISDFTTQPLDTADWTVEVYNVSADKDQQSPWGRSAAASNVVSTPSGLELWVRSQLVDGGTKVSTSEINSVRRDILYGTFRVGMTIPYVPGSCAAFFYYRDDASEIDLEFLSQDASAGKHPMYFVLHDVKGDQGPAPAPLTPSAEIRSPSFQAVNLATDLTSSVHEYRFDWAPEGISFYFDGVLLASYTDPAAIPSKPGMLAFNHWSNGNKYWTRGPPTQDSKFVITYVHAWFNTAAG